MSDLVTWLRTQLDADEQTAQDALRNRIVLTVAKQAAKSGAHAFWSRHDPARVLRQVAAMRVIVDLHAEPHECADAIPFPYVGAGGCPTLRHLATIYADRDGYRPEWAPEGGR